MIYPIGNNPIAFSGNKTIDSSKQQIKPAAATEKDVAGNNKLYEEISAIDKQIAKLEEECSRQIKTNSEFDLTATYQEIGKLINHRIILQSQLEQGIEKVLSQSAN